MSIIPTGNEFEEDVRRVARAIWADSIYNDRDCIDGRERDIRIETKNDIIFVECTTEETVKKVRYDVDKLKVIIPKTQNSTHKLVRGVIVTHRTPTQHQIDAVKPYSSIIRIVSLERLQAEFVDVSSYLNARSSYRYGSAQNLKDQSINIPDNIFVEPTFALIDNTTSISFQKLRERCIVEACITLVTGDFGVGKSMTCREIFLSARKNFFKQRSVLLPLYLNLRDHTGQTDPTEAIYRHAKRLGYENPNELVRAWRGGFCLLILDGFDEMATSGWGMSLQKIRQHRYAGMALIRNFLSENPKNTSVLIAGRTNFFDSAREMYSALGIQNPFHLAVDNFTDEQIKELQAKLGAKSDLPPWLPTRPLLAGYFILNGFDHNSQTHWPLNASDGWDMLLDAICTREASQDQRLDPSTVREILERLSTIARNSGDGLGKFDIVQLHQVFTSITGLIPDEGSQQFLARLPGLRPSDSEDGTRQFIDIDYTSALRPGDVKRLIDSAYTGDDEKITQAFQESYSDVRRLTTEMVANHIVLKNYSSKKISAVLKFLLRVDNLTAYNEVALAAIAADISIDFDIQIQNCELDEYNIEQSANDFSRVTLTDCIIHNLYIDTESDATRSPKIDSSIFSKVSGARNDAETARYTNACEAIIFTDQSLTSDAILRSDLPPGVGILLTSLRKLYLQSGNGRKSSAFFRGVDPKFRQTVGDVLDLLCRNKLAVRGKQRGTDMYFPNRKHSERVRKIMSDPFGSEEDIVAETKRL